MRSLSQVVISKRPASVIRYTVRSGRCPSRTIAIGSIHPCPSKTLTTVYNEP